MEGSLFLLHVPYSLGLGQSAQTRGPSLLQDVDAYRCGWSTKPVWQKPVGTIRWLTLVLVLGTTQKAVLLGLLSFWREASCFHRNPWESLLADGIYFSASKRSFGKLFFAPSREETPNSVQTWIQNTQIGHLVVNRRLPDLRVTGKTHPQTFHTHPLRARTGMKNGE